MTQFSLNVETQALWAYLLGIGYAHPEWAWPKAHSLQLLISSCCRKTGCGNHLWSKGYCVDTVGLDAEMICKYVKYRTEKDRQME